MVHKHLMALGAFVLSSAASEQQGQYEFDSTNNLFRIVKNLNLLQDENMFWSYNK